MRATGGLMGPPAVDATPSREAPGHRASFGERLLMPLGPEVIPPSESLPHPQCSLFWGPLPSGHMQKTETGRGGGPGARRQRRGEGPGQERWPCEVLVTAVAWRAGQAPVVTPHPDFPSCLFSSCTCTPLAHISQHVDP